MGSVADLWQKAWPQAYLIIDVFDHFLSTCVNDDADILSRVMNFPEANSNLWSCAAHLPCIGCRWADLLHSDLCPVIVSSMSSEERIKGRTIFLFFFLEIQLQKLLTPVTHDCESLHFNFSRQWIHSCIFFVFCLIQWSRLECGSLNRLRRLENENRYKLVATWVVVLTNLFLL